MKTRNLFFKIKAGLLSVLLVASLTSCDDFLTVPSESNYDSENLFQTVVQARMAAYGAYVVMTHPMYGRKVVTMTTTDCDILRTSGGWETVGRRNFSRYSSTPASVDTELSGLWNKWYSCIERCNICIERIPQMALYSGGTAEEQAELKRIHGEMLALRALCYLDLIVRWGDVPARFAPSKAGEVFYVDRTSRDEIYDQIISDLKTAVELTPWRKEVAAQARFTKGAVKGLLARVCLHAAGYSLRWDLATGGDMGMRKRPDVAKIEEYYELARQQCADVIDDPNANHRLNPVYQNIWKNVCAQKFDTEFGESMFEIGMYNPEVGVSSYNGQIGNKIGANCNKESKYGMTGTEVRLTAPYILSFKEHDTRFETVVADMEVDKNSKGIITNRLWEYNPGKWRAWWCPTYMNDYTNINWIYMRYADVLLMFAEAENYIHHGPTDAAVKALKEVRKRAYKGNEAEIENESYGGMNEDQFLDVLIQERAWELGAEALRKFDLIRWNKLGEMIQKTKDAQIAIAANTANYPKYCYYKPCDDPTKGYPEKVYSNIDKDPAYPTAGGWVQTNYTNKMSSNADIMTTYARDFQANKTELYPIPQSICDDNPKLSQHPSYR